MLSEAKFYLWTQQHSHWFSLRSIWPKQIIIICGAEHYFSKPVCIRKCVIGGEWDSVDKSLTKHTCNYSLHISLDPWCSVRAMHLCLSVFRKHAGSRALRIQCLHTTHDSFIYIPRPLPKHSHEILRTPTHLLLKMNTQDECSTQFNRFLCCISGANAKYVY